MRVIALDKWNDRAQFVDGWLRTQPSEYSETDVRELIRISFGMSRKDSAHHGQVTESAVHSHRKRLFEKLRLHTVPEVIQSMLHYSLEMHKARGQ